MLGGIDQHDVIRILKLSVLKYSQIYYKYFQFNKYTELRYYSIENFVMVNFGILQSPTYVEHHQEGGCPPMCTMLIGISGYGLLEANRIS